MANKRVYYACYKAGIAPNGSKNFVTIHGLQSLGMTTTFNLEQVFEIGQISVYENIETIPTIEVTTEKVLDGYTPVYLLATQGPQEDGTSLPNQSLQARGAMKCLLGLLVFDEGSRTTDQTSVSPGAECQVSGLYVSSVRYQVPVNGHATESVTMVANHKVWLGTTGWTAGTYNDGTQYAGYTMGADRDTPYSQGGSGGVNRREDVIFGSGNRATILPSGDILGLVGSGFNVMQADGSYPAHIQSISITANMTRDDIFELGRRGTYYKSLRMPIEVTTEISIFATSGDMINAAEEGLYNEGGAGTCGKYNLTNKNIRLNLCEGLWVDCGVKNKLASVATAGGNTGGGNVELTYTYRTFNDFTVIHPQDPNVALRTY